MGLKKKIYKVAPLPFMGQKRRFINEFIEALKEFPNDAIYVDLFGGSGLLSHTVKSTFPEATVVYNDFDNYRYRIENVERTNILLSDLRDILKDCPKDKLIKGSKRVEILERISNESGFVDYITLSSSLLFSMNYVNDFSELQKMSLYNKITSKIYEADDYLDDLTIVCMDYKELFSIYRELPNVVFIVDPPYLSTENKVYKNYWRLADYLDILELLISRNFFYFTSNKSSIIELVEWLKRRINLTIFENATSIEKVAKIGFNAFYTDIMLYKSTIYDKAA